MNYHNTIAKFLTANAVLVAGEGLGAAEMIPSLPFNRILVISTILNDMYKMSVPYRKEAYMNWKIVYTTSSLI